MADLVEALVESGHSEERVLDEYTIDQAQIYHEACIRAQARRTRELASAIRVAQNADRKLWKKYIEELSSIGKRIDEAAGRVKDKQNTQQTFAVLGQAVARRKHG